MMLIKNGLIVDPSQGLHEVQDIFVADGMIQKIGKDLVVEGAEIVDASGMIVMPGAVDMHVHLREPGDEHKETILTGVQAAIHGGFTSVACMPNTNPVADHEAVIESIMFKASKYGLADVYPIAAITKNLAGEEITEMGLLKRTGAVAFSDDGKTVQHTGVLRRAMDYSKMANALLISHCEDKELLGSGVMNEGIVSTELGLAGIPNEVEDLIIARDLAMAKLTGCRVHIAHVSTAGGVELVAKAKADGVKVTAETTPHHLLLTDEAVRGYDTNTKVNPPLRKEEDRLAVFEGLKKGIIDCVATDHAPHAQQEKEVEYAYAANGVVGLETAVPLIWTNFVKKGLLNEEEFVTIMSRRPAEILQIDKGTLQAGKMADILILNPDQEKTVEPQKFYSKGKNTPFGGMKLTGWPEMVIKAGKMVYRDDKLV